MRKEIAGGGARNMLQIGKQKEKECYQLYACQMALPRSRHYMCYCNTMIYPTGV